MQTSIVLQEKELATSQISAPFAAIIMPFNTRLCSNSVLQNKVQANILLAEKKLSAIYSSAIVRLLIQKLQKLASMLFYSTDKKSIVFCVSKDKAKLHYLEMEVTEKIIIDSSVFIRELALSKPQSPEYLLLVLSNRKEKLYLGDGQKLTKLIFNNSDQNATDSDHMPESGASNYCATQNKKDIEVNRFFQQVYKGLELILQVFPLPVILVSTPEVKRQFMELSVSGRHVVECISGNYDEATDSELKLLVEPYLKGWNPIKQKSLLRQVEDALSRNKCALGIADVSKAAEEKRVKLLILERRLIEVNKEPAKSDECHTCLCIQASQLDTVIGNVLFNGGDIEIVADRALESADGVASILYY